MVAKYKYKFLVKGGVTSAKEKPLTYLAIVFGKKQLITRTMKTCNKKHIHKQVY